MWQIMKNNVEKRMPQNIDELTRFLAEEWEAISQETVNNLVSSSVPSRSNRLELFDSIRILDRVESIV